MELRAGAWPQRFGDPGGSDARSRRAAEGAHRQMRDRAAQEATTQMIRMGAEGPRRTPGRSSWPRTILHVDLDAFYTSVHQRDDPTLRGQPVAVAGRSRRAVVMGASYEARPFGVRSAMPLHEALALCPQLTVVNPDPPLYREASRH